MPRSMSVLSFIEKYSMPLAYFAVHFKKHKYIDKGPTFPSCNPKKSVKIILRVVRLMPIRCLEPLQLCSVHQSSFISHQSQWSHEPPFSWFSNILPSLNGKSLSGVELYCIFIRKCWLIKTDIVHGKRSVFTNFLFQKKNWKKVQNCQHTIFWYFQNEKYFCFSR